MSYGQATVTAIVVVRRSPRSLREAWVALAGLSAVFLFEMLDNSILNVALPTIGRELHASTTALQWVTGAYAVVFGGLMLAFGAIADRFGRRRIMLIGLVLLGVASLATAFVTTAEQLIAVRAVMGVAAAMTTPGSMALAFRLFDDDGLRVRATTLISTVGLVGLAIGPTVGGFVLAVAPWQVLLLVNVPIAVLAIIGVRFGIAADVAAELHRDPVDVAGAVLGTATIVLALVAPTLFVNEGAGSWVPWAATAAAVVAAVLFVLRERSARSPAARPQTRRPPAGLQRPGVQGRGRAGDRRPRLPGDAAAAARLGVAARTRRHRDAAAGRRPRRGRRVRQPVRATGRSRPGRLAQRRSGRVRARRLRPAEQLRIRVGRDRARARRRRDARRRRRRRGQRAPRPAEEPDHDRRGARRHRHRGHLRRRHRRHRHHPRGAVHRRHRHLELERRSRPRSSRRRSPIAGLALTVVAAALVGWGIVRGRSTRTANPVESSPAVP